MPYKDPEKNKEYSRQYKISHKEYVKKYNKLYRGLHKKEIEESRKNYCTLHKKELTEKQRKVRQTKGLTAKEKEGQRRYKKLHPEKCRRYDGKRRAMKRQIKEYYTAHDERYTLDIFGHKCFNCGTTKQLEIDHIYPLSTGNALTRANACVLCKSCNCKKHDKMPEDFYPPDKLTELFFILFPPYAS